MTSLSERDRQLAELYDEAEAFNLPDWAVERIKAMLRVAFSLGRLSSRPGAGGQHVG